MQLGEAFVGDGANAAHVNTVLGPREGPVGTAWATALATPTAGHAPFVVVIHPNMPVKPFTLLVNKARIESDTHARMTWGPAQAGVAAGVLAAFEHEVIYDIEDVLIAAVWVDPKADDEHEVYGNNLQATWEALERGRQGRPTQVEIEEVRNEVWNPFFTPPPRDPPAAGPR